MKLQRIDITNFKSINRAVIDALGPINLFFGPTNSGKTSLLESIFFQFHHDILTQRNEYTEFLHSRANPADTLLQLSSRWVLEESVPAIDLHPQDVVDCETTIRFHENKILPDDRVMINGKEEDNPDRRRAISSHIRASVKFSSSRRPGDTKHPYFPGEESNDQRRQRFLVSLQELKLQGDRYHVFLSHLQKLFPHLVYGGDAEADILEFFGMGFLGTAKLFVYLFDARYQLVLIDEPEIHFYPSLTKRFVAVLHEVIESLNKQIILATHSPLFLQERRLGNYYHISKSKHFVTSVRRVDENNLLENLDILNAPPEAILQSDIIIYVEGPTDIGVVQEFLAKFPELDHTDITVLHLGGGAMGNVNVEPLDLKKHNPLSFLLVDSERTSHGSAPDPAHAEFLRRCTAAHLFCLVLDRRALENYFTPRALRVVFREKVPRAFVNSPYKPLVRQGLPWYEKKWNRTVAHAMTREEILGFPDLRKFFQEILLVNKQVQ
ncbi:MAG: AAA family ATPase [bacterium]